MNSNKNLVFLGMMGSGKSSIGNLVSLKLDLPFVDIDNLIIKNTNMTVSEIFDKKGEDYFRDLEEKTTLKCLKKIKNVIGNNTISAVRSGFFWGYAGLIDNIINLIKKETRKSFNVIITGGFSNLFKKSITTKVSHNKDITIKGLIKISKLIK